MHRMQGKQGNYDDNKIYTHFIIYYEDKVTQYEPISNCP